MMKTGLQEEILRDKYLVFCIHIEKAHHMGEGNIWVVLQTVR